MANKVGQNGLDIPKFGKRSSVIHHASSSSFSITPFLLIFYNIFLCFRLLLNRRVGKVRVLGHGFGQLGRSGWEKDLQWLKITVTEIKQDGKMVFSESARIKFTWNENSSLISFIKNCLHKQQQQQQKYESKPTNRALDIVAEFKRSRFCLRFTSSVGIFLKKSYFLFRCFVQGFCCALMSLTKIKKHPKLFHKILKTTNNKRNKQRTT